VPDRHRDDIFYLEQLNGACHPNWKAAGSKDMYKRANERAREILAAHQVPPLSEDGETVIAEILAERVA